ncbi:MAG: spinster family MFS transporter [Ktedonobacterales bacterium]
MSDATLPEAGPASGMPSPSSSSAESVKRAGRYAAYVFWLMFIINFLNYLDRWIFTGLSFVIQPALRLDDFQIGLLTTGFLLVYTIVAMPLGFLADRRSRKGIVGLGVAIWSVATALTGLAGNFVTLFGIRALLGIGEGSYYPAGTPMLAAYYPPSRRAQILSRWSVGALVGAAVGFLVAAPFASPGAWRWAFFFTGIPGLIFAFLIWRTREKIRHEDDPPARPVAESGAPSVLSRVQSYLRIPTVRVILGTQAFGFFALTGATSFLPIYLNNTYGRLVSLYGKYGAVIGTTPGAYPHAGLSSGLVPIIGGGVVLAGGIFGNLAGGVIADRLGRRYSGARVLTGGLGFLLAMPCLLVALGAPYVLRRIPSYTGADESTQVLVGVAIFVIAGLLAAFFLNLYTGPMSAALLDVVPPDERGSVGGLELTLAHLLGDVYAAALIGAIATILSADLGGEQVGLALLLTCPLMLLISGIIGIRGSGHYAKDVARVGSPVDVVPVHS